jgi:hypothetical protein
LFKVRWAKNVEHEERGFITMSLPEAQPAGAKRVKGITAKYEPWVFAKDVAQYFYLTDPSKPSRVVVRRGKRSIVGMDRVANEDDYDQFGVDPIEEEMYEEQDYTTRRSRTTLPAIGCPFLRKGHSADWKYSSKIKKTQTIVERVIKRHPTA